MNHLQALKELEKQSKQANAEVKKIIATNMNQLEQGLQHQTKDALSEFQKNLTSVLRTAQRDHQKAIRWNQWLIWIPLVASCLLLGVTGWWATQKINALTQITAMTAYPTSPYQEKNYAIVPPANVTQDKSGNYWIKLN